MLCPEEGFVNVHDNDLAIQRSSSADPTPLLALNVAMDAAAFLLFYARLKHMLATSPFLCQKVDIVSSRNIGITGFARSRVPPPPPPPICGRM